MKLKRVKRARKIVAFFRAAHKFKPPFDVLLDGTAIQASIVHEVSLADALAKVLGVEAAKVRLLVPRAVVAELHVLGRKFAAAAKVARRLRVVNDEAASSGSASDAIVALVAGGNPRHRFVMTEDTELRDRLAALPGVPLLRFARAQIVVELPGGRGAQAQVDDHAATAAASAAGGSSDGGGGKKRAAAPSDADGAAPPAKKRRGVKEPNPLSCKKKKKTPPASLPASASVEGGGDGKRKRRRRKKAGAADNRED